MQRMNAASMVLTPRGVRFLGAYWPCTIGRGGVVAQKREGDGGTPTGTHRIVGMLYRPDRVAQPQPWAIPIRPGDLWSDDVLDDSYNQQVRVPYEHSHETLRRADPLYDVILVTDWNWPKAEKGAGSAIFLHQWRRPGFATEGCIAFRRDHFRSILSKLTYGTQVIVPQTLAHDA